MATSTLADASALRDGNWYRLHPLTPVLQGGVVVLGFMGFALAALWETVVVRIILGAFGRAGEAAPETDFLVSFLNSVTTFGLVIVGAAVFGAASLWWQWRVHLVRMDGDVIEVKKGVVFRSSRRTRRDRVNTIGVRRPLIPRMLGLAKLDIQAAGSESNIVLAYLPHAIAQAVRQEILEPFSGEDTADTSEPSFRREVEVPLFRYLASLVVSLETVVLVVALAVTVVIATRSEELVSWLGVVLSLFVFVIYLAGRFFRVGSFVIDTVEGDIRVSLGLLSTSVETIPPERIHALQISQPWPWRFFGWWRIDANLASSPGSQVSKAPAHTMIIPAATTTEMLRVVGLALPALTTTESTGVITDALEMSHEQWVAHHPGLTHTLGSPQRSRYRIPLSASVNGVALQDGILLLRTGQWIKKLSLVPLARVQSLAVGVGPWHEALDLMLFSLHSVSGPVSTTVPAMDREQLTTWWGRITNEALQAIADYQPRNRSRPPLRTTS